MRKKERTFRFRDGITEQSEIINEFALNPLTVENYLQAYPSSPVTKSLRLWSDVHGCIKVSTGIIQLFAFLLRSTLVPLLKLYVVTLNDVSFVPPAVILFFASFKYEMRGHFFLFTRP